MSESANRGAEAALNRTPLRQSAPRRVDKPSFSFRDINLRVGCTSRALLTMATNA